MLLATLHLDYDLLWSCTCQIVPSRVDVACLPPPRVMIVCKNCKGVMKIFCLLMSHMKLMYGPEVNWYISGVQ